MFEGMVVKMMNSLLQEKILTPEKIAAAKAAIIQKIADEKIVENTVDSLVDVIATAIMSFVPKDEEPK